MIYRLSVTNLELKTPIIYQLPTIKLSVKANKIITFTGHWLPIAVNLALSKERYYQRSFLRKIGSSCVPWYIAYNPIKKV